MITPPADDPTGTAVHDALCARLRGEDVPISPRMIATARCHRIHLVLATTVQPCELESMAVGALIAELRQAALLDLVRERALQGVVESLARAGVDALLLKGAGLAYVVYPSAYVRPRSDIDVMVARATLERAEITLAASGWVHPAEPDGELITGQRHYMLASRTAWAEHLDLHWKIANPQLFSDAVVFEELLARAVPVAALGPHARTLSIPDALFVACLHRVAHHQDAIDLLWLWDIHLLASRLSVEEQVWFVGLAARASMRAVCARGLELASARFQTVGATRLVAALQPLPGARPEPSAQFLGGDLRQVDLLQTDLLTLRGWRARLALVGQHLFPSAAYMQSVYPGCPAAALPLAYVHRILRGAPKWFRRPPPGDGAAPSEEV
jgi:hypothetical protein